MAGSSSSSSKSVSGPNKTLMNQYYREYANALKLNTQNYQNLLHSYAGMSTQGLAGGTAGQMAYQQLGNQVQDVLGGAEGAQRQELADIYNMNLGKAQQGLINSGLGNTTVGLSAQRGLTYDYGKQLTNLAAQTAQMRAGYMSQLGSAGIQALMGGYQQMGQLGGQYLGALASYRTPYPSWPQNQTVSTSQSHSVTTDPPQQSPVNTYPGGTGYASQPASFAPRYLGIY